MNGRPRLWTAALCVAAAVVVALGVYLFSKVLAASSQLNGLRAQQSAQSMVISNLSSGLSTAEQQLTQHGIKPLPPPPQMIIQQGATGPQGPGPSDAQVFEAVTEYLTVHPLPTAPPPSAAQISTVVAAYLQANPPAAGKDGAPGAPASDAQVADAVAAYLAAHPPAAGDTGPAGSVGAPGVAGPSGAQGSQGVPGEDGRTGPVGPSGEPGAAGPACPDGYAQAAETINGHAAIVCEQPAASSPPPTTTPSGTPSPTPSPSTTALFLTPLLYLPRDQRRR